MKKILVFLIVLLPLYSSGQKDHSAFLKKEYVQKLDYQEYHNELTALLIGSGSKKFMPGAKPALIKHLGLLFPGESIETVLRSTQYYKAPVDFEKNFKVAMLEKSKRARESFSERPAYPNEHLGIYRGITYTSAACGNNIIPMRQLYQQPEVVPQTHQQKTIIEEPVITNQQQRTVEVVREKEITEPQPPKKDYVQILREKSASMGGGDIYIKNVLKNEAGATPAVSSQNGNGTPTIIFMQVPQQQVPNIPMPVTTVKKNNGWIWGLVGGAVAGGITYCVVKKMKDQAREIPKEDGPDREVKPGDRPDRPRPPTEGGDDDFQGPGKPYDNGWRIRFSGRAVAPAALKIFLGSGGFGLRVGF